MRRIAASLPAAQRTGLGACGKARAILGSSNWRDAGTLGWVADPGRPPGAVGAGVLGAAAPPLGARWPCSGASPPLRPPSDPRAAAVPFWCCAGAADAASRPLRVALGAAGPEPEPGLGAAAAGAGLAAGAAGRASPPPPCFAALAARCASCARARGQQAALGCVSGAELGDVLYVTVVC